MTAFLPAKNSGLMHNPPVFQVENGALPRPLPENAFLWRAAHPARLGGVCWAACCPLTFRPLCDASILIASRRPVLRMYRKKQIPHMLFCTDISAPMVIIRTGSYPRGIAADPKTGGRGKHALGVFPAPFPDFAGVSRPADLTETVLHPLLLSCKPQPASGKTAAQPSRIAGALQYAAFSRVCVLMPHFIRYGVAPQRAEASAKKTNRGSRCGRFAQAAKWTCGPAS